VEKHASEDHRSIGLERHGLTNLNSIYWNLSEAALYEYAIRRQEGIVANQGPLLVETGQHTGRSAKDKFVVQEATNSNHIWWGSVNQPLHEAKFNELHRRMGAYLYQKDLFVQDCWVGADITYRLPIRIITQYAWHSLFARNMFIETTPAEQAVHQPALTVIVCPQFYARPEIDGTNSGVFIALNLSAGLVLIGGTSYAGEIKKAIFTLMNYLLPFKNVLPMHCSANYGPDGQTALFFGLSGTGKTTLSADPARTLIGDDEHGWSDQGVFNFEGGCYAKTIRLSSEAEPEIYAATHRFGTVLENVMADPFTRRLNLDDDSLTENTRAAYSISQISNATPDGVGHHPQHIIFLAADAFGVLPPIAKLTPAQAMYHFLSGYTAKVAGTEKGVTEPQATFSACFGAPFLPLPPGRYAELLGQKLEQHQAQVWLVNTGWSGGPYGLGDRMKIAHTRSMVNAVLAGQLDDVPVEVDPIFGLSMPVECPEVPAEVLHPRHTWADKAAYDAQAHKLANMFVENFKQFAGQVSPAVQAAGPRI